MSQLNWRILWCFIHPFCQLFIVMKWSEKTRKFPNVLFILIYKDTALVITTYSGEIMLITNNGFVFFWVQSLHLKHHEALLEITCPWALGNHGSSVCFVWHHSLCDGQPMLHQLPKAEMIRTWVRRCGSPRSLYKGDKLYSFSKFLPKVDTIFLHFN